MTIYVCVVLSTNKRDKPDCLVVFVTELNWPGLWGTLDTLWVLGTLWYLGYRLCGPGASQPQESATGI